MTNPPDRAEADKARRGPQKNRDCPDRPQASRSPGTVWMAPRPDPPPARGATHPLYFPPSASRIAKYAGFGASCSSHGRAAPSPGKNAGIHEYLSV
ncbi:hypothetical protein QF034_001233 [Streptomyces africanus]|uniref:Uncharacterized protein n=1 Tax=Streptomyces africanus TaxID=231024 RepID=A0ABU0QI11_9ACTN|nr:hypothetical protein [Streptomyces africanus]